jgi:DNA-binding NarL/FixJ family response regulator
MAIDSQRAPQAQRVPADDTWLPRGGAGAPGPGRLLDELRAQVRTACLPVVVLTAQHGETAEKALDLGAHDYLSMPVQTRSLVAGSEQDSSAQAPE